MSASSILSVVIRSDGREAAAADRRPRRPARRRPAAASRHRPAAATICSSPSRHLERERALAGLGQHFRRARNGGRSRLPARGGRARRRRARSRRGRARRACGDACRCSRAAARWRATARARAAARGGVTDAVPTRMPGARPSAADERVARHPRAADTRRRRARRCRSTSCPSPSGRQRRCVRPASASSSSFTNTPRSPISPNGWRRSRSPVVVIGTSAISTPRALVAGRPRDRPE